MGRFRFFQLRSLGGWLTIINMSFWIAWYCSFESLAAITGVDGVGVIGLLLSWPLTFPVIVASLLMGLGGRDDATNRLMLLICFLNSFVWGYGLAAIIRAVGCMFSKRPRLD